ncbi:elongation factor 1-beta 2-like isoform X4 [Brassica napus]|uniref:elongation factor 1-beta 2-like isoform X4 n=1 Tax=Brassica napus TaxID=3708 RepID=UPI0020787847|nr:elongation factor 1-beta 2-like isoform X4 [Brassica napus]
MLSPVLASGTIAFFPGKAVGVSIGCYAAPAQAEAPAADDDDDMDHFGDETEEEKKAAEEREATKKDTKKPKESG